MKNRLGKSVEFKVDHQKIQAIKDYKKQMGADFPRLGILVLCYNTEKQIESTLRRIPVELHDVIDEIYVFDNCSADGTIEAVKRFAGFSIWKDKINIYKNPENVGYGGNQKAGYNYAIKKGIDYTVMLHGDGQYAPEFLPDMILPIFTENQPVVYGSRMLNKKKALEGGMPLYKWLGNTVLTTFENIILGTTMTEFHSGYRLYSSEVLKKIPFNENTNDWHFDTQIIIQCRALNLKIHEIPIDTFYGDEECNVNGVAYAMAVCAAVLEYRLHQLHVLRRSRYFVDYDVVFTRKLSPFSSHGQILKRIQSGDRVLDFSSNHGVLHKALFENGVKVVHVGPTAPKYVDCVEKHYVCDLSRPEAINELGLRREFDVVLLAENLEEIKPAKELIEQANRFLKPEGRMIVCLSNIAMWFYRLALLLGRFNYGGKGPLSKKHVHLYTRSTALQLLARSGASVGKVRNVNFPFEVLLESIGQSRVVKLLDWFYSLFVMVWPSMFAYQFIFESKITRFHAEGGEGKVSFQLDSK